MRIRSASGRLGRVGPALTVHAIQIFGFHVIRLEVLVTDWPSRGHTAMVTQLFEILLPQSEKSRAVEFRISPNVIVCVRVKGLAGRILPDLFCLVFAFDVYSLWIPVVFFPRDIIASFEEQDSFTQESQRVRKSSAPGARADDDDIELLLSNQVALLTPGRGWLVKPRRLPPP